MTMDSEATRRRRVAQLRLRNHRLARNPAAAPETVVAHFGAMQAQDYLAALWAVGVRTTGSTEADVERAIEERRIVRCWPMRGTIHFVAAEDARWMLELLAPRVLRRHRMRLERDFALDGRALRRSRAVVERALRDGRVATRSELYEILEKGGVPVSGGRGLHVVFALAHELVICFGPRRGKQPTFVLLDAWLPSSVSKEPEEARAELARRFLASHGPATAADFAWWSGLTLREATAALAETEGAEAEAPPRGATVHILPAFDEYTVAYRDRSAILDPAFVRKLNAGGGMLNPVILVNGMVAGTWKRRIVRDTVVLALSPFRPFTKTEARAVETEASRYADFLGLAYFDLTK